LKEDSSTSGYKHSCLAQGMSGRLYSFFIYKESAADVVVLAVGEEDESSDARWMLAYVLKSSCLNLGCKWRSRDEVLSMRNERSGGESRCSF
jgi:hypothetical protein